MVMTILEAHVASDKSQALEQEYRQATKNLDPEITQTFLLHDSKDQTLWRIATVWSSREALDAMRKLGETPRGVLMFRAVEAEPVLSIFDIAAQAGKAENV